MKYGWARPGDVNAFFGLMLDNAAVMVMLVTTICLPPGDRKFTPEFVLTRMIPGTALGVLAGDLVYTWMAFRLARRTGRTDVTAMPLGLDTPSTIAVSLFILPPALGEGLDQLHLNQDGAMHFAWRVGAVVLIISGLFKVVCAPVGNLVRRCVPSAGLLGSLAAIALALIAFVPLFMEGIAAVPLVGMLALTVIFVTLVAHRQLPGKVPGALAAVVIGAVVYFAGKGLGDWLGVTLVSAAPPAPGGEWHPPVLLSALTGDFAHWNEVWASALNKLPVALPFALATIVGGIDCTESAAAAGDEYDTRTILLTEAGASLLAGCLGGVIQTTPYIGQPAYKKMGGRAAYTLAAALFIGAAGYFGWFTQMFHWLPQAAMFPILVFVGLEITAQSYHATPVRHYPAVALATLPALAALTLIPVDTVLAGKPPAGPNAAVMVVTLRCLGNSFIVTSLLWAACLAAMLDGRMSRAAAYLAVAGLCALFGVIHSPFVDARVALPWDAWQQMQSLWPDQPRITCQSPYHWAAAYGLATAFVLGAAVFGPHKSTHQEPAERANAA
jgi:AGZA family xanthine/uracil permease-like MFS transporter